MAYIKKTFFWLLGIFLFLCVALSFFLYITEITKYFRPETSLMFDDSFMFVRYARIWLLGYGESWNMGELPAFGNTSQLHFFLVLLITALFDWPEESLVAFSSILPSVVIILWLPFFAARHGRIFLEKTFGWRYVIWMSLLFPLLYWTSPFSFHSGTGMDAQLSFLMHLWLIDAVLCWNRQKKNSYLILSMVVAILAYMTRPDNLLVIMLFPFLYMGFVCGRYRQAFIFCLSISAAILIDTIIKYYYFGDFLPLSYYSKRSGFLQAYGFIGELYHSPFRTIFVFWSAAFPFLIPLFFCVNKKNLLEIFSFLFPACLSIAYYFTMVTIMNFGGRYFFPFLPYFIAAAVVNLHYFSFFQKKMTVRISSLLLIVLLGAVIWMGKKYGYEMAEYFMETPIPCDDANLKPYPDKKIPRAIGMESLKHFGSMLQEAPQGAVVAMTEHGYVGAKNPHIQIIDLAGLHNRHIAHEGFSLGWFFQQKPDLILAPHWQYSCLNAAIFGAEAFWQDYELYPHLFSWGLAVRKNSPYYLGLQDLLKRKWAELYPGKAMEDYKRVSPFAVPQTAEGQHLINKLQ